MGEADDHGKPSGENRRHILSFACPRCGARDLFDREGALEENARQQGRPVPPFDRLRTAFCEHCKTRISYRQTRKQS